jgi:hypothetical protein
MSDGTEGDTELEGGCTSLCGCGSESHELRIGFLYIKE